MNDDRPSAVDTVLVLDLDDTLYPERDYVRSGNAAVRERLESLFPDVSFEAAFEPMGDGTSRLDIGALLVQCGLPAALEEELAWVYRLHRPRLALRAEIRNWLARAERRYAATAIVTDGRPLAQRQKLSALGLGRLEVLVSAEHDGPKPAPGRFIDIERRYPASGYAYVGDNPRKDFLAPNARGWLTVCLRDAGRNVHPQSLDGLEAACRPKHWIGRIPDVDRLFAP